VKSAKTTWGCRRSCDLIQVSRSGLPGPSEQNMSIHS